MAGLTLSNVRPESAPTSLPSTSIRSSWPAAPAIARPPVSRRSLTRRKPVIKKCDEHNRAERGRPAGLRAGRRPATSGAPACRLPAGGSARSRHRGVGPARSSAGHERCSGCSVVKPTPASTCWQWRATVRADRPAKALAMAAVSGEGSSHAASSSATEASMATRLSARRWRTAWKVPIGRPNWTRSNACRRASSSIARADPDELVAEGEPPQRHGPVPVGRTRRRERRQREGLIDDDKAELRVDPPHGPAGQVAQVRQRGRPRPRRDPATTSAVSHRAPAPVPKPCTRTGRLRCGRARRPCAAAGAPRRRRRAPRLDGPSAAASSQSSAADVRCAAPWPRRARRRRWAGRPPTRRANRDRPAQRRARRRCSMSVACRTPPSKSARSAVVHQRSSPRSRSRRAMMLRWISALPP